MNWDLSQQFAEIMGARLPSQKEMQDFLKSQGNKPQFDNEQWAAVNYPKDFIQVGNGGNANPVGASHLEMFGYPGWGDAQPPVTMKCMVVAYALEMTPPKNNGVDESIGGKSVSFPSHPTQMGQY